MRVCRLNPDGTPVVGASSLYTTSALVEASFTPEIEEGAEITQKNGSGALCLTFKAPSTLKSLSGSLSVCTPDPELLELLTGGTVITDGSDPVGWAFPEVGAEPMPNGVSVELWSRAVVDGSQVGYFHWALPRLKLVPDQFTFGDSALVPSFKFTAEQNPNWATGPVKEWEYESGRVAQYVREAAQPADHLGYQTVSA